VYNDNITIYVFDKDNNPYDWGFDFVVVGPR
jgi:hypothetical protein